MQHQYPYVLKLLYGFIILKVESCAGKHCTFYALFK